MMGSNSKNILTGRSVLLSSSVSIELIAKLEHYGTRLLTWPKLDARPLDNYAALNDSIENLFGYDWLVFQNVNAVDFFLRHFRKLGHEISELDALRICGVGEEVVSKLEASQIHLDVIPDRILTRAVFDAIEIYAGGSDSLRGLNFLIPNAGSSIDYLSEALQDAGARVDCVATYRTCGESEPAFGRIRALLSGGGIDCVVFATCSDVREFAEVFDTNDLGRLLKGIAVACLDQAAIQAAATFGLTAHIVPQESSPSALSQAIAFHFLE